MDTVEVAERSSLAATSNGISGAVSKRGRFRLQSNDNKELDQKSPMKNMSFFSTRVECGI